MAFGWSPAGWNGDSTRNLSTCEAFVVEHRVEFAVQVVQRSLVPQHAVRHRGAFVVTDLARQAREGVGLAETPSVHESSNGGLGCNLHRPHRVERERRAMFGAKEWDRGEDRVA